MLFKTLVWICVVLNVMNNIMVGIDCDVGGI